MPIPDSDLVLEADRAEQAGDAAAAIGHLRRHLGTWPGDAAARLRYGRLLAATGEIGAARHELSALEEAHGSGDDGIASEANRILAGIDEGEGALDAAAQRWERLLADDVDDPQARARLRRLRPADEVAPVEGAAATLVSPEGVQALRYRLLRELGRGATSAVYLARDEVLDIPIALKVLHPQMAGPARSDARRRFFVEARLAAALRHPGVIAIYDLDEQARTLSMEYVAGGTLRARLRRADALGAAELAATARSLLAALAYVHDRGIAHGDLKPSNLLLRAPGAVVLADFGIAQLMGAAADRVSEAPAGTPLYLAPEQFRGAPTSPATDLYAAGAILWEMAVGRPMRQRSDLVAGGVDRSPPLPDDVVAALGEGGPALAGLVAALTHRLPADRPSSACSAARILSSPLASPSTGRS
jgi:serine/threonine protein kinase